MMSVVNSAVLTTVQVLKKGTKKNFFFFRRFYRRQGSLQSSPVTKKSPSLSSTPSSSSSLCYNCSGNGSLSRLLKGTRPLCVLARSDGFPCFLSLLSFSGFQVGSFTHFCLRSFSRGKDRVSTFSLGFSDALSQCMQAKDTQIRTQLLFPRKRRSLSFPKEREREEEVSHSYEEAAESLTELRSSNVDSHLHRIKGVRGHKGGESSTSKDIYI